MFFLSLPSQLGMSACKYRTSLLATTLRGDGGGLARQMIFLTSRISLRILQFDLIYSVFLSFRFVLSVALSQL